MAQDVKKTPEKKDHGHKGGGGHHETVSSATCKSEGCKRGPEKFGFCLEHYEFYMAGVLRGDGKKPIDYEDKLRLFQQKHHKKVA